MKAPLQSDEGRLAVADAEVNISPKLKQLCKDKTEPDNDVGLGYVAVGNLHTYCREAFT